MMENDISAFWDGHPCGEGLIGVSREYAADCASFFERYDAYRYRTEGHILRCLDSIGFHGRRTLEIGLGQGADSEQIIRRGARWSGLDLTPESVARVSTRLRMRNLPFDDIKCGSALDIPYADASFDIVYSHGVLHHVPNIARAQTEIHRVLRPNGALVVMLYAKWSLNYLLSIALLRRLGLTALYALNYDGAPALTQHVRNARVAGLRNYLRLRNFIHRNTDGPLNPYSKVYDLAEVQLDFRRFEVVRSYKRFMHAPPLPVRWLPLAPLCGWHLWVHLRPRAA